MSKGKVFFDNSPAILHNYPFYRLKYCYSSSFLCRSITVHMKERDRIFLTRSFRYLSANYHRPPGPPPWLPELYEESVTVLPPDTVPPILPMPPKYSVPPLTVTPDFSVVVPEVETISALPPLDGVLKAMAILPLLYRAYQVFLFHEEVV